MDKLSFPFLTPVPSTNMMKFLVALFVLAIAQVSAFSIIGSKASPRLTSALSAEYEPIEGESKINLKVKEKNLSASILFELLYSVTTNKSTFPV